MQEHMCQDEDKSKYIVQKCNIHVVLTPLLLQMTRVYLIHK